MRPQMVQMSFLEIPLPAGAAPVWAALDEQQRAEVVKTLARVIANVADARRAKGKPGDEEKGDE